MGNYLNKTLKGAALFGKNFYENISHGFRFLTYISREKK